jgi:DNA helicase-2/ATP-dependent DNA helicase PcrA
VSVIGESAVQLEAITHPGGPLLILGGAGTGKTYSLLERFAWLGANGTPADAILVLTFSATAADDLRERIEQRVPTRYEELTVATFQGFCARLLREEALEAGIDPFATPVTGSDRLAMLLERIDELPLASHDLRGNPSALLGSIVQRIDRLKDELVTAADYEAWASKLPDEGESARVRAVREREFAAIYAAHDRMLAEAGTLDFGDLVLHAFRLLRSKPQVRARVGARFRHRRRR